MLQLGYEIFRIMLKYVKKPRISGLFACFY